MSKTLYPKIYIPSTTSVKVFLRAGDEILSRLFSRPIMKTKILNWRLPDQTVVVSTFEFMDGTAFDFMDGTDFDFTGN